MKICIIHINQNPPPLPTIEEPPHRFIRHLTPYLDFNVEWDIVRLLDGDLPNINDYDGYLITGGSAPLVADVSELPETTVNLLEFIRNVYDSKIPIVGICWGHQAICKALGGVITKLEKYGMGIRETHVIKKYDWMQKAPDTIRLYSMHTCQVTTHPKDGELFLSSDFCPNAGYVFGNHALTIQQHPDYNIIVSEAMINSRKDRLPPEQFKIAKDSLATPHHTELSCQWVSNFFAQHRK